MGDEGERVEIGLGDGDAEFFGKLAHQRGGGRFAGLDLATGKFPQPGKRLARRPLRHEHPAGAIDERCRHDIDAPHHALAQDDQLDAIPHRQPAGRGQAVER